MHAINPAFMVMAAVIVVTLLLFLVSRMLRARRRQPSTPHEKVPITLLPKTSLGRWSLGLAIASIVIFVVASGPLHEEWGIDENGDLINPALTGFLTIIIVAPSAATLVTGLISVLKRKERSVIVFLGMLITFWWGIIGVIGALLI